MAKFAQVVIPIIIALTIHQSTVSQSLSVNTDGSTAHPSALLDVKSTAKGVLVPRMSKTERTGIAAPATGLMVFQNAPDSVGFYFYNGTSWLWLATATGGTGWLTTGNTGTDTAINFLGTLDDKPLMLRQNNLWMGQLNSRRHSFFIGGGSGFNNDNAQNTGYGDSSLFNNTTGLGNTAIGYRSMLGGGPITGNVNVAVGNNSLTKITTGGQNVAIGDYAAHNLSTGNTNIILGPGAMESATKGDGNIALGLWSLRLNDSASRNIAIGQSALYSHNKNDFNIGIGYQSLYNDTASVGNVALGHNAAAFHRRGDYNTALGHEALQYDSISDLNVAVGWRALRNNKSGVQNTALGVGALEANRYGSYNTAIGRSAGFFTDTVNFTTAIGYSALTFNTRERNTAVGAYAGYSNSRTSTDITQGIENTAIGYGALNANGFGSQNTAVGYKAHAIGEPGFLSATVPSRNVSVGDSAFYNGRGNDNVSIGYRALSKSTTNHHQSVAIGSRALLNAATTYPNTAVGYSSQDSTTTGFANTSLGSYSLTMNKGGSNNTAIGNAAMFEAYSPTTPSYPVNNTAVGNDALRFTRYYGHVAVGAGALRNDTSGVYNTAVGYVAMNQNLSGIYNTALGTSALRNNLTGSGNTSIGLNSMYEHSVNHYNTAVGYESMRFDSSGDANTAMGWRSLRYNKSGNANTAIGVGAVEFTDSATANTAVGRGAMIGSSGLTTNLAYNTAVGFYAGALMSNVEFVTAIGMQAGYNNRGSRNTFLGYNSGNGASGSDLTGIENTGLGAETLTYNNSGKSNTAVGLGSLFNNRTGYGNTGVGTRTLVNNTTGNQNVAIGDSTMFSNNGDGNTVIGYKAGNNNATGNYNTLYGYNANVLSAAYTNAAAFGTNAAVAQNNSMVLGSINGVNSATANTTVGIGTTTPNARLHVRRNGTSGGSFHVNASMIIEDNFSSYFQFSNPTANETGFLSGNAATTIRSAIIFRADSSIRVRTGGNIDRMIVDNGGYTGINRTPTAAFNYGTLQVQNTSSGDDIFGLYTISTGNRWTYWIGGDNNLYMYFNGASRGNWNSVSGNYTATSDKRLKKDITSYNYGIEAVKALTPYKYRYLDNNSSDQMLVGFMAQDVLKIYPEAVYSNTDKDGKQYYSIDYQTFSVLSIKAIKEQQEIIEKQQKTLDELLKRVEKLENK